MVEAHADELAAVVIEPLVQGASGMLVADLRRISPPGAAAGRAGTLSICDEVATGFGRTGTLFASEQCGLAPTSCASARGSPAGTSPCRATVASGRVFEAFLGGDLGPETFYHGHSYGGNALAAAVALEHLRLFESVGRARQRARPREQLANLLENGSRRAPPCATSASAA